MSKSTGGETAEKSKGRKIDHGKEEYNGWASYLVKFFVLSVVVSYVLWARRERIHQLIVYLQNDRTNTKSAKDNFLTSLKEINDWPSHDVDVPTGPCNIPTVNFDSFTQDDFINNYAWTSPFVLRNYFNNAHFSRNCTMENLSRHFGHTHILLSSANTHSYEKRKVTLREYFLGDLSEAQNVEKRGNETFYFFGDNNYTEWDSLFRLYKMPPLKLPGHSETISFGVASAGTGVPFHFHGPGFAETIFGRKRWFLTDPDSPPNFHGDTSSLKWFTEEYENAVKSGRLWECTLEPSDLIYFPGRWWHATLNLDTSVFVSTFLSPGA